MHTPVNSSKLIFTFVVVCSNSVVSSFISNYAFDNRCQSNRVRSEDPSSVLSVTHVLRATGNIDPSIGVQDSPRHISILNSSLQKYSGKDIYEQMGLAKETSTFRDIYQNSRFALISHNTEMDPIYNYANEACQEIFAKSHDELCVLPSRSCVAVQFEDEDLRVELMRRVTTDGYVDGATG